MIVNLEEGEAEARPGKREVKLTVMTLDGEPTDNLGCEGMTATKVELGKDIVATKAEAGEDIVVIKTVGRLAVGELKMVASVGAGMLKVRRDK